jgi:hypothetical protein
VKSEIQTLIPIYTKFENILPDELSNDNIFKELEWAKHEINSIINDDLLVAYEIISAYAKLR